MNTIACVMSIFLISMLAGTHGASAAEDNLAATLRDVMEKQTAAYGREDQNDTMNYVHTKSPKYNSMKQALPGLFETLDVRTQVVDFRYLGHDDEFAVARVKLKTTGGADTKFTANILDTIVVFHQQNGAWKFWSDEILGVELVQ